MVDEEGQVKLIDFGIAAPARVAGHEIFGSPGHMPPEQIEGRALGPEADIFAVAALLLEAWSGKAPFRRATAEASEAALRAHGMFCASRSKLRDALAEATGGRNVIAAGLKPDVDFAARLDALGAVGFVSREPLAVPAFSTPSTFPLLVLRSLK